MIDYDLSQSLGLPSEVVQPDLAGTFHVRVSWQVFAWGARRSETVAE